MQAIKNLWETWWTRAILDGISLAATVAVLKSLMGLNWIVASGFTVTIIFHEIGHIVGFVRQGIPVERPILVPGVGAIVKTDEKTVIPHWTMFASALRGPLTALGAIIPLSIYWLGGSEDWRKIAFLWLSTNLLNWLPIYPLDGGAAMASMLSSLPLGHIGFTSLSVATMLYAIARWKLWLAIPLPLFAAYNLWLGYKKKRPKKMDKKQLVVGISSFFGLFVLLLGLSFAAYFQRDDALVLLKALGAFLLRTH